MRWPNTVKNDYALPSAWPILSAKDFLGASNSLKRKDDSSRFPSSCVAVTLSYLTFFCQEMPFWNINQIPFRTDVWSLINKTTHLLRAFASGLGATHPCPIAVHKEPFSTSVFKGYTWIVATSTKICTKHRSTRLHSLTLLHLMFTPPYFTYCIV